MNSSVHVISLLVSSLSILVVQATIQQDRLLKLYPYQNVCDLESSSYQTTLTKFTEKEIKEKCQNYKYAQITETCGQVSCCNVISDENTDTDYISVSTQPNLVQLCPDSLWSDATFGAFNDGKNDSVSTLYILDDPLYQTHDYFGCVSKNVALKYSETEDVDDNDDSVDDNDDSILAVYLNDETLIRTRLNKTTFQFRLWDFSPDCHTNLYQNSTYPVGMDIEIELGVGVAIYCPKVY